MGVLSVSVEAFEGGDDDVKVEKREDDETEDLRTGPDGV
jgi:hypothetical protein